MPEEMTEIGWGDIESFISEHCRDELNLVGQFYPKKQSVLIDFQALQEFSPQLSEALLNTPDDVLREFNKALDKEREHIAFSKPSDNIRLFVRFQNLPPESEIKVRDCISERINKFFTIRGLVTKTADVLPKVWKGVFICKRCKAEVESIQTENMVRSPAVCEQCGRREFEMSAEKSKFIDFQRAEIQEPLEMLKGGEQAKRITVWLENDLTNKVVPGQKLILMGILRLEVPKYKGTIYQKFIEINNLQFTEQEFEELEISEADEKRIKKLSKEPKIIEKVIDSIAPSIYGHTEVKEAIALQLFGGASNKQLPDGMKIRGNIHVLLIGDPGCLIGDERVALGNGAIVRLESMGSEHLQEIYQQILTGQGYKRADATVFHTYKNQPVMEIVTESGKSIKGTYNHPLLIVDGREWFWKRLDEIEPGDRVAVTTWIPCTITAPLKTGWSIQKGRFGPKPKVHLPKFLDEDVAAFLGYVLGDGWVTRTRVAFDVAPGESDLLPQLEKIVKAKFGLEPHVIERKVAGKKPIFVVDVHSVDLAKNLSFLREKRVPEIVMASGNKVAAEFIAWLFEADGCVFCKGRGRRAVQLKSSEIELLRDVQTLLLRFGVHSRINERNLTIRRAGSIRKFAESIGFRSQKKKVKLKELVANVKDLQHEFGKQLSERVVEVRPVGIANVFDIEVPNGHRFIANGIISHNTAKSQILKYVNRLAPKSLYVSGKSATGGGLTAIAEKDEFGEGGWVLKAGALVIASGGLACIDEFDKMSEDERSSIHEALEQQTVSVAKAGIIATFKSETAVLAAANPKYARFDPYRPPFEQFDIPATLLSRFDLIFPVKDVLDETKDKELATHILNAHKLSQTIASGSKEDVSEIIKSLTPPIEEELLRKYVAYSRKTCHPVLTEDAITRLKDYYVDLRKRGVGGSVPLTPRQLEGLVRLAEASAKLRLKKNVELEDAERAIRLVEFVLRAIGMEKESGVFDIDRIITDHPKSERDKIYTITGIVKGLEEEYDMVPVSRVMEEAQNLHNIDNRMAEKLIEELVKKGDLYEPKYGHLKTVSR